LQKSDAEGVGKTIAGIAIHVTRQSDTNANRPGYAQERAASEKGCRCLKIGSESTDRVIRTGGKDLDAEIKNRPAGSLPQTGFF